MQALHCNLMACLLLIQAVTGWCCYSSSAIAHARVPKVVAETNACCRQCEKRAPRPQPLKPCKCDECLGICTYLPVEKATVDRSELVIPLDVIVIDSALIGTDNRCTTTAKWPCEHSKPAPALRLHLLHQSLLI